MSFNGLEALMFHAIELFILTAVRTSFLACNIEPQPTTLYIYVGRMIIEVYFKENGSESGFIWLRIVSSVGAVVNMVMNLWIYRKRQVSYYQNFK
jgi:uncharacterized membrane-anchored protein